MALGEPALFETTDVGTALLELGLGDALAVVEETRELLRRSRTLLAPEARRPALSIAPDHPLTHDKEEAA